VPGPTGPTGKTGPTSEVPGPTGKTGPTGPTSETPGPTGPTGPTVSNDAGYWFTTDDYIEIADNASLNFGIDDFSIIIKGFRPYNITKTEYLVNKEVGGIGYGLYKVQDDLYIRLEDNNADASAIIGTAVFEVGKKYNIGVNFDRSGNATAFVDGNNVGTVDISGSPLTLDNAGSLRIGCTTAGSSFLTGEIASVGLFNMLLSDAECVEFSLGNIPFKYLGDGLLDNPGDTYTSGTLVIGRKYIITTYVADDDFENVGAENETGCIFTATETDPTNWTKGSTLTRLGCVLNLNSEGVRIAQWFDDSGNENNGTVRDAVPMSYLNMLASRTKLDFITATQAVDLDNMIDMEKGASSRIHSTIKTGTVLTWEDAGYIPVDTTSGAVQLTMPALSVDHVGVEFIFALTTQAGGNYLTIISNAADHNFYVMNGSNSGDGGYIRMISAGTVVIVKSGYPGGGINANWIITGGSLAVEVLVP